MSASTNERRGRIHQPDVLGLDPGNLELLIEVPLTAAIKAACERVDDLQPSAELLSA